MNSQAPQENRTKVIFTLVTLCLLGAGLTFFYKDLWEFYNLNFGAKDTRPIIARVTQFEGEVTYKLPKTLVYKEVKEAQELRDQDTVVTGSIGSAQIAFDSGFQLELLPNSVIIVENPKKDESGAIVVTFLRGDFRVVNQGSAGKLLINKGATMMDAAGPKPPKPLQVTIKATPTPLPTPTPPPIVAEKLDEIEIKPAPKVVLKPKKPKETLPEEYVTSVLRRQISFFNRCHREYLRLNPNSSGTLYLSFTIESSGDVSSIRVLKSTIPDPRLEQCTMAVIERTKFKAFDGDPVVFNYPINYE